MTLYIPNPAWREEDVRELFSKELRKLSGDVNLNSLISAAIHLDELGRSGRIHGLSSKDYLKDPVHLLAHSSGGKGKRMGMIEKPMVKLGSKRLIEYVLEALSKSRLVRKTFVVISENVPETEKFLKNVSNFEFELYKAPGKDYISDLREAARDLKLSK